MSYGHLSSFEVFFTVDAQWQTSGTFDILPRKTYMT